MNIDTFNKISTLSEIIFENLEDVSFDEVNTIYIPNNNDIKYRLDQSGIKYNKCNHNLSVDINKLGIKVFYDEEHFRKIFRYHHFNNDFAVLVIKDDFNDFQYYDKTENKVFTSKKIEVKKHFLIENTVYYLKLLKVLKSEKIADYVNGPLNEIIIFDKEGIRKLKYPSIHPLLNVSISIKKNCELLFKNLRSKEFPFIFKNELAEFSREAAEDEMMVELINKLPRLNHNAEINLRLYLKDFSFEKLKSEIQKEKIKYFESLRNILGKFINQVIAIPLSISATAFATYQIENSFILTLALSAFLIYSLYVTHVQIIYLREVRETEKEIEDEFATIRKKLGPKEDKKDEPDTTKEEPLGKEEKEKINEINNEEKKVIDKLKIAKITIITFLIAIISLTLLFILFIAIQRLVGLTIVIVSTSVYIGLIAARFYIDCRQVKVATDETD
jgi:hypothetical protein